MGTLAPHHPPGRRAVVIIPESCPPGEGYARIAVRSGWSQGTDGPSSRPTCVVGPQPWRVGPGVSVMRPAEHSVAVSEQTGAEVRSSMAA